MLKTRQNIKINNNILSINEIITIEYFKRLINNLTYYIYKMIVKYSKFKIKKKVKQPDNNIIIKGKKY